jgi:hypothetical protein
MLRERWVTRWGILTSWSLDPGISAQRERKVLSCACLEGGFSPRASLSFIPDQDQTGTSSLLVLAHLLGIRAITRTASQPLNSRSTCLIVVTPQSELAYQLFLATSYTQISLCSPHVYHCYVGIRLKSAKRSDKKQSR